MANVTMNQVMALLSQLAAQETQPKATKRGKSAKSGSPKVTKDEFLVKLVAAATKLKYENPVPYETILTYGGRVGKVGWLEKGRQVKEGEHSIKVDGRKTGLFHISQTEALVSKMPSKAKTLSLPV